MDVQRLSSVLGELTNALRHIEEYGGSAVEMIKITEVRNTYLEELRSEISGGIQALCEVGEDYQKIVGDLLAEVKGGDEDLSGEMIVSRRRPRKRQR